MCVLLTVINVLTIQPRSQMLSQLHLYHDVYLYVAQTIVSLSKYQLLPLGFAMNKQNFILYIYIYVFFYRNKNAKLVILKQNGCQLLTGLVEMLQNESGKRKKGFN